jgi:amino acid adenylation domain-containing protein
LLHELFEAQVSRTPQALAVVCEQEELSYAQLNARANQVAHLLRGEGVRAESLVGLCMERGVQMVVGLLGVLKAGGAYVPLDPGNPLQRLRYVLEHARPTLVLTQEKYRQLLEGAGARVLTMDGEWELFEQQPSTDVHAKEVSARSLAYVIYTSGSTGEPKGVMVEHSSIVNYALDAAQRFAVAAGEGSLLATSISFDLTLTSLYPPLMCGRAVRLCAEQQELSAALLSGRNLAPVKLTPSHLRLLEEALANRPLQGCVQALVLGGETLTSTAVAGWRERAPGTRIFNHYGPTETTVGCIVHEVRAQDSGAVPIGRPIANTRVYVLDERLQPVPIGVVGEICIGGAGVARGYLHREELTAQRFLADPFRAGGRMYRSGDLGRWRADGSIEYVGRNDQQVKLRGFRIELGEIETALARQAGVKDAVVLAREDVPGEKRLVGYVTSAAGAVLEIESLRAQLKALLPEYMVPAALVVLDELPLTANGKVDRKALSAPELAAYATGQYEAPQGEIEQTLAQIWCELLQIERVGRYDNFFELGGHSLLAVQLIGRLRQVFGVSVPLVAIFSDPVLTGLATAIYEAALAQFAAADVERLAAEVAQLNADELQTQWERVDR